MSCKKDEKALWKRFQKYYREYPELELSLDISRMNFPDDFFEKMEGPVQKAFDEMAQLEAGQIANPDENRMVGHYWLRNPALAPAEEITKAIEEARTQIEEFVQQVHHGEIEGETGPFKNILLIGIGGSALGPQFVSRALGNPGRDPMRLFCFDNTDPETMDDVFWEIGEELGQTLCVVISKSGGTKETRNGMLEAKSAYEARGLCFEDHAVAVTMEASDLYTLADENFWLETFPMWDWVGGRTSQTSAVGLLVAALQGIDIDDFIAGAAACDALTRQERSDNPAMLLALMWYYIGQGKGLKDMVVLPYKDRLELFSRYLQQLIMESLGKALDRDGKEVKQGIAVYGNKGSTDQHAFVQQLRDGINNFFVTFIEVLRDRQTASLQVEPGICCGDYLQGFYLGTREALYENGRESITLTIEEVTPFNVGVLIALYERAVGFYASLIHINAYHQPGVEAGKKAATEVLKLKAKVQAYLIENRVSRPEPKSSKTAAEIAEAIGCAGKVELVFKVCEHLASNPDRYVQKYFQDEPTSATYQIIC
ncbi:MAG: glucose-6-phosphate isomerase [Limisphaerales bacterium]|nr:glucose-6-phosphate isomerase [Verrucomicrobiota bacterium]